MPFKWYIRLWLKIKSLFSVDKTRNMFFDIGGNLGALSIGIIVYLVLEYDLYLSIALFLSFILFWLYGFKLIIGKM
jgi:hypothetical protein